MRDNDNNRVKKQRIVNFNGLFGTAISLCGTINNKNIMDYVENLANELDVKILAVEDTFIQKHIALSSPQKSRLEFFLYRLGDYVATIKQLETTYAVNYNPLFN